VSLSALTDHLPLLVLHAALISAFLALLWRETAPERRRFFARTLLLLVGGSVAAGWLMALVPTR
jgi:hypothetical protein